MRIFLLSLCAFFALSPLFAAGGSPGVEELLDRVDRLYRSETSRASMEMEIVTPEWSRTLVMDIWTEGLEKTFIRIKSPARDAGAATLRKGNEMWNYFPKINKVMKVPPSMMMGSWMGSDFTNDDLVKESTLLDDYTGGFFSPEKPDAALYYIKLKPKKETVSLWGSIELEIRKSDLLPVSERYYDEKGRLQRTMEFSDITELGGREMPRVMKMTPVSRKGHVTTIRYLEAEFDPDLPADTFTLRNLQRVKMR